MSSAPRKVPLALATEMLAIAPALLRDGQRAITYLRARTEPMAYLFVKLFPYIVVALAIGIYVGWLTCNRSDQDQA